MARGLVAALLVAAGPALAQTGDVSGVVVLKGPRPASAPLKVTKDFGACGQELPDDSLVVGAEGGVANALVVVQADAPAEAPAPGRTAIDQKGCRFLPRVAAIPVGSIIDLTNSDAVLHNARAMLGKLTYFNYAFPLKNSKRQAKALKPGVLDFRCDAGHTWMRSLVHVLPHRWFALSDESGKFRIEGVPAETKALEVRHEWLAEPLVVPLDGVRTGMRIELVLKDPRGEVAAGAHVH